MATGMELDEAVDSAIDNMPDGYELKAQIMEHGAEGARCPGDIGIAPTGVKRRQGYVD